MQQEKFFPDPKADAQQQAMLDLIANSTHTNDVLERNGWHSEAAQQRVKTAAELRDRAYTIARTVGLYAISEGELSRVKVANMLGVHQATVAKWVIDAIENPEPDRDYTAYPLTEARTPNGGRRSRAAQSSGPEGHSPESR